VDDSDKAEKDAKPDKDAKADKDAAPAPAAEEKK